MLKDPIVQFAHWFTSAKHNKAIEDATVMCVSTLDRNGFPDSRMVLLKGFDKRGFVFFTNLHSAKGRSIQRTPRVALTFYWPPLKKQVRVQGKTQIVSNQEADAYWKSRPRLSQLSACASKQSEVLSSRSRLVAEVTRLALKYRSAPIPRPSYWTGVRIIPHKIEFWLGGANRLHDRILYTKKDDRWKVVRLYP